MTSEAQPPSCPPRPILLKIQLLNDSQHSWQGDHDQCDAEEPPGLRCRNVLGYHEAANLVNQCLTTRGHLATDTVGTVADVVMFIMMRRLLSMSLL